MWYHLGRMKLITRHTDYAIRALCEMVQNKQGRELFSVTELAKKLKIPRPFLRKLLQILNHKGVLKSYKGQGGGFKLARPPHRIWLLDLIRIFQGPVELNKCMLKKNVCPNVKTCILRKKVVAIEKYVVSELKSVTIASLFKSGDKSWKNI